MECGKFKMNLSDVMSKSKLYVVFGGLGTLIIAYGVCKLVYRVREDNYFTKVQWRGGNIQRRVLVLGLEGAGKTRLLQCFDRRSKPWVLLPAPTPSFGVNVKSAGISGIDYHFWDVCYDQYGNNWRGLVRNMDVLVWVVDSSEPGHLGLSRAALHGCMKKIDEMEQEGKEYDHRRNSYGIPIVIVATKQDLPTSVPPADVLQALEVEEFRRKHKVHIVGVQIPNLGNRAGLWRLFELISWADRKRYIVQ